jgi:hypothetical protein
MIKWLWMASVIAVVGIEILIIGDDWGRLNLVFNIGRLLGGTLVFLLLIGLPITIVRSIRRRRRQRTASPISN